MTAEEQRLQEARAGVPWRTWGPYLSERQWGTVREDYSDTGDAWYLSEEEGRIHAHRGTGEPAGPSDCVVSGPASGLYLFLWNRSGASEAGVTVSGDQAVLALWQSSVRVRWD